jgi:hypothetical protein
VVKPGRTRDGEHGVNGETCGKNCFLFLAEGEDHSGAEPEIALVAVMGIQELRVEIFGLREAHVAGVTSIEG